MISNGAEDDDLTLSPNTLECLNEYLLSNQQFQDSSDILKEDWQVTNSIYFVSFCHHRFLVESILV